MTKPRLILALAALLTVPAQTQATPLGFYAGLGGGEADFKDACDNFSGISCDDTDTAWKIFGGYQWTDNWGAEFSYFDGAEVAVNLPPTASVEGTVFTIAATGTVPIGDRFSLFGQFGGALWKTDLKPTPNDDNGISWAFGAGAQFEFTERFGVRAEWQRTLSVGSSTTGGRSDIDLLSASVVFFFGQ
jgi:OOP family OmpA-OmpF porin